MGAAAPSRSASNPDPRVSVGNTLGSWVRVVAARVLYLTVPLSALPRDSAVHHTAERGGQKRDLVAKPSPCQRLPHVSATVTVQFPQTSEMEPCWMICRSCKPSSTWQDGLESPPCQGESTSDHIPSVKTHPRSPLYPPARKGMLSHTRLPLPTSAACHPHPKRDSS